MYGNTTNSAGQKGAAVNPTILLVEDNDATRFGFSRYFSKEGYKVQEAADLSAARTALDGDTFDAIVLDINLPDGSGIDFIDKVRLIDANVPIIVITGSGDIQTAVIAMQHGADNFLTKPIDNQALSVFLRKTLEVGEMKRHVSAHRRLDKNNDAYFGDSPAMQEVMELAQIAAGSDSPILLTGETGTGKGMLSKWIHCNSRRSKNEFVEVNCSGLRGELLAREIFGNSRGAYTSADQDRKGLLDIAHRGTLLLDEIGDMSIEVQAQFLKVLEDKSYRRLGDTKLFKSDFRLISATNHDIETLVREGRFRQDLLYRINLIVIHLPPLRERTSEFRALISHLLRELGSSEAVLTDEVVRILEEYSWPGNIRELRNVLERALLLTPRGATLRQAHFANLMHNRMATVVSGSCTVQELEERHILTVLKQMDGDVEKAAKSLNLSRATLYRRLKKRNSQAD
jgi:DNA-binding NtrC family response regulator